MLLETRGSSEVTSSPPKPLAEEPPSTADADAREAEDMVNSILQDSPTPNTEEGGKKRPDEIPTGMLFVPFSSIFWICIGGFCDPKFFSRSSKSRGSYGES